MPKKLFLFLLPLLLCALPVRAKLNEHPHNNKKIKAEMKLMLESLKKLDIQVSPEEKMDYPSTIKEGENIKNHITKINSLNTDQAFKKDLARLEKRCEKMVKLAKNKSPQTSNSIEKVLDTCLNCHQTHKGPW